MFPPESVPVVIAATALPVVVAFLFGRIVLPSIGRRIAAKYDRELEATLPMQIRGPVEWLGVLFGLYIFKSHLQSIGPEWSLQFDWNPVDSTMKALALLVFFIATFRAVMRGIAISHGLDESARTLLTKVAAAVVIGVGAVTILTQFRVDLGPVLASLGVAGLAVALALQDTLGNYFAGITMSVDRPLRPGDYVKLEGGAEGFVESIGWRTTRIKPFSESVVVVPNSKLASSILTNNYYPDTGTRVYVDCGVSYESDLAQVERVCIEVAREMGAHVQGFDTEFEVLVRFKTFGESNIMFTVILRALSFDDTFLIQHEYIKALHKKFGELGIKINYPVRDVRLPDGGEGLPAARPR